MQTVGAVLVLSLALVEVVPTAASAQDTFLCNGDLWVRLGPDGGLREITARGAMRDPTPADLSVPAMGTLEIAYADRTVDAASLAWSGDWVPGTTTLALVGKGDRVQVKLSAFLVAGKNLLALRYSVSGDPAALRYVLRVADETAEVSRTARTASLATQRAARLQIPALAIGSDPPGAAPASLAPRTLALEVKRHAEATFYLGIDGAEALDASLLQCMQKGVEPLATAAASRDRAFLEDGVRIETPDDAWSRLFDRSLLVIRDSQLEGGALLAGMDGWYKNIWQRDGAYTAMALDLAGHSDLAERFYRYWMEGRGLSWGTTNGEVQEPAIVLYGIAHHATITGDRAFLEAAWPFVRRWADWYAIKIDTAPGLLLAVDEWICSISGYATWPNAEIVAGLRAAALVAAKLGHGDEATRYGAAARTLAGRILTEGFDRNARRFVPYAGFPSDDRVDSGLLNLARHEWFVPGTGAIRIQEPRMAATLAWIERTLLAPDGNLSRFEANPRGLGYPDGEYPVWPIGAAWLAQVDLVCGYGRDAEREIAAIVHKSGYDLEASRGYLPEQWSLEGPPVRTTRQLTWSHGEFVATALALLACVREGPTGSAEVVAHLPAWPAAAVRNVSVPGGRFDLSWKRETGAAVVSLRARGEKPVHVRLRFVPDESEVLDAIDVAWQRDGAAGIVDVDLPAHEERALRLTLGRGASVEAVPEPLRWRTPYVVVSSDAPRAVREAAEGLREVLAVHASSPAVLVDHALLDLADVSRDLIVVGDPRNEPAAPDALRQRVRGFPDPPINAESFVLRREIGRSGSTTLLAGHDERRTVLAVSALVKRIRDASLADVLKDEATRNLARQRRIDSLVQGEIGEWLVCGPFPLPPGSGRLDEDALGGESAARPEAGQRAGEKAWSLAKTRRFGELRFDDAAFGSGAGVVYAHAYVRSPEAREAALWVGSKDSVAVWWNGKLVHRLDANRDWRLDRDRVPVKLDAGWNRLLLKTATGGGGFSLSARVADPQGNAFPDVEYRAARP